MIIRGEYEGMAAIYGMLAQITDQGQVGEFVKNFLDETYTFK